MKQKRRCCRCREEKLLSGFNKKGTTTYQSYCKPCQSEHYKEYYRKNIDSEKARIIKGKVHRRRASKKYVIHLKDKGVCTACGRRFHHAAMDFDHVEDNKKMSVSHMVNSGYTIKKVQLEIDKCELVCANCHRVRTYDRG